MSNPAAPVLLDTAAIALHYGAAATTVRRWAHEDHWTPYGTRRHRRWDLTEAQRSWETRHRPQSRKDEP